MGCGGDPVFCIDYVKDLLLKCLFTNTKYVFTNTQLLHTVKCKHIKSRIPDSVQTYMMLDV